MNSNLIAKFEAATVKADRLQSTFRGSLIDKIINYPWRVLLSKAVFEIVPSLQNYWIVKNQLFTGQDFFTEGYFMDYYLCGIISEEAERPLSRWLLNNVDGGQVFYDVGAHYGYYSLVVEALSVGNPSVIFAFEPTPTTQRILQKNTAPFETIKVVQQAVADSVGRRNFNVYPSGGKRGSNSFYAEAALAQTKSDKLESVTVETTTIDEFTSTNQLKPTLIKLDIENAELDALRGGLQTLKQYKPKIVMEVWPSPNNQRHIQAATLLKSLGYDLYMLDANGTALPISGDGWFNQITKTENLLAIYNAPIEITI